jgi:hypothetical protein
MSLSISSLNEADAAKLKTIMHEATAALQRIEDEKEALKELIDDVSKKFDIPKRDLNNLAKVMFKRNFAEKTEAHENLEFLYTSLVGEEE